MKHANTITHWDDFSAGETYGLGQFQLDPSLALAFDRAFANPGIAGEAGASDASTSVPSGMLFTCRLMRAVTDSYLSAAAGLGAGGVPVVRWPTPDVAAAALATQLSATMTCRTVRTLKSRPGVGLVELDYHVAGESGPAAGETVTSWRSIQFMAIRSQDQGTRTPTGPRPVAAAMAPFATPPETPLALGAHSFTADTIVAFAKVYDPQRFHLDDAQAADSLFGALCASGWHTCAVWHRMLQDHLRRQSAWAAFGPGPGAPPNRPPPRITGLSDVVWARPVYVDDVITYFSEDMHGVHDAEAGGSTMLRCVGLDGAGVPVFRVTAHLTKDSQ